MSILDPLLANSPSKKAIAASLALGGLGFFVNLRPLELEFGLNFVFGSAFSLLALRLFGRSCGLIAAGLTAAPLIVIWNHPIGALVTFAEAVTLASVGLSNIRTSRSGRRGLFRLPLVTASLSFWVVLGIPFVVMSYQHFLGHSAGVSLAAGLKQAINGIFNTALSDAIFISFLRASSGHNIADRYTSSIQELVLTAITLFAIGPILSFISVHGKLEQHDALDRAERITHSHFSAIRSDIDRIFTWSQAALEYYAQTGQLGQRLGSIGISYKVHNSTTSVVAYDTNNEKVGWERIVLLNNKMQAQLRIDKAEFNNALRHILRDSNVTTMEIVEADTPTAAIANWLADKLDFQQIALSEQNFLLLPIGKRRSRIDDWTQGYVATVGYIDGVTLLAQTSLEPHVISAIQKNKKFLDIAALFVFCAVGIGSALSYMMREPFVVLSKRFRFRLNFPDEPMPKSLSVAPLQDTQKLSETFDLVAQQFAAARKASAIRAGLLSVITDKSSLMIFSFLANQRDNGYPHFVSESLETITGFMPHDMSGRDWYFPYIHPEDRQSAEPETLRPQNKDSRQRLFRLQTKYGRYIWIRESIVWGSFGGEALLVGIWLDVTTEVTRQKEAAHHAKLAELGALATGLAHELSQPLHVIQLTTANLGDRFRSGDLDAHYALSKITRIQEQVERASTTIDNMKIFGRPKEDRDTIFRPEMIVRDVLGLMEKDLRDNEINLIVHSQSQPVAVRGNPAKFERVIINLLTNAKQAILSTLPQPDNTTQVARQIEISFNSSIPATFTIAVADTGGGIAPEAIDRIFDPFFTTKGQGGTGLGLSLSYGIITEMQGKLTVQSDSQGATFSIELPVVQSTELLAHHAS